MNTDIITPRMVANFRIFPNSIPEKRCSGVVVVKRKTYSGAKETGKYYEFLYEIATLAYRNKKERSKMIAKMLFRFPIDNEKYVLSIEPDVYLPYDYQFTTQNITNDHKEQNETYNERESGNKVC